MPHFKTIMHKIRFRLEQLISLTSPQTP